MCYVLFQVFHQHLPGKGNPEFCNSNICKNKTESGPYTAFYFKQSFKQAMKEDIILQIGAQSL